MNKDQVQKIIDFYNKDDVIIMYLLKNDDFQGFIEVDIEEDEGGDYPIFLSRSSHPRAKEHNYLHECNTEDFRFYIREDIFKEPIGRYKDVF